MEAANMREAALNTRIQARENELAQMTALFQLTKHNTALQWQKFEALELAVANERAAKIKELSKCQQDIVAKNAASEIALRQREEHKRASEKLKNESDALQKRGFMSRPEGWDQMNPNEQNKCNETIRAKARTKLGIDANTYNLAVTGGTGTGKSSLINSLRLITDSDAQSAITGEVETTMEAQAYGFPASRRIVLWDLPGADTVAHPAHSYFMDKKLMAFDCVMIVTAGRFTEIEFRLGETCREFQVPVIFVRNKSDQSLASMMKKLPFAPQVAALELKAKVERNMCSTLAKYKLTDAMIFLVSAWAFGNTTLQRIDETRLLEFILNCAKHTQNI